MHSPEQIFKAYLGPNPPARIIGTETENTVSEELLNELDGRLKRAGYPMRSGRYLDNGAKVYPDLKHVEYASAEGAGPLDATACDWAGVNIVHALEKETDAAPVVRRAATIAPNTGRISTKGRHENYMIINPAASQDQGFLFQAVMSTFLATRGVITGAGFSQGESFTTTQKGRGIGEMVVFGYGNRQAEQKKPLGGISEKIDRQYGPFTVLEARHADPHLLPYADFMSLAITSLGLRLLEQRTINYDNAEDFILINPIKALDVVDDPTLLNREELTLLNGEAISPVGLQRRFARAALSLIETGEVRLPKDEQYAVQEWLHLCNALAEVRGLERVHLRALLGKVEWATKLVFMERIEDADDAIELDMQWSTIGDRSIGKKVAKRMSQHPSKLALKRAAYYMTTPPQTRAQRRAKYLRTQPSVHATWSQVMTGHGPDITMDNPYRYR